MTDTATGLSAGTYTVTVTDGVGCTASTNVTLTDVGPPTVTATAQNTTCGNTNGEATANASGGTPPYSYLWNDATPQTTMTAIGLAPNTYTVTVTDALDCTATTQVNIVDDGSPTTTISGTDPTCEEANGTATVVANGGLPPYTYAWSLPSGATTATADNLAFGTYTVTVTDANGCIVTDNITLNESELPTVTLNNTDASCGLENGEIFADVSGGAGNYTYMWSIATVGNNTTALNLATGTYSVTITDALGCTISAETILNGTTAPTVNIDFTTATCSEANGTATAIPADGQAPYQYIWNGGNNLTDATTTGLVEGTYNVTITDANGCTASQSVNIPNVPAPTATTTVTDANCGQANGTATVVPNGGQTSYTYQWDGGNTPTDATTTGLLAGTYNVTVTDGNGCTVAATANVIDSGSPMIDNISIVSEPTCEQANGSATVTASGGTPPYNYEWSDANGQNVGIDATATNLGEGTYSVNVIDANNCVVSESITLTNQPSLTVTATATLSSCGTPDGVATAVAQGGLPPYSYQWNDAGTQSTDIATNLPAGDYTVIVTDANGCTASATATVDVPAPPVLDISSTDDFCLENVGTATVTVTGGSTPYNYIWNDENNQQTATATNLAGDTTGNTSYEVTVTDAAGCTASTSVIVNATAPPTLAFNIIDENCGQANGEITITPSGVGGYTYQWSIPVISTTATASGLIAGDYTVTVTDANACETIETVTVLDEGAPTISIVDAVNPACGVENGEANVNVNGGTPPFNYLWTGPNGFNETEPFIEDLTAGTYTIVVTDQIGCTASADTTLVSPSAPTVQVSVNQTICGGDNGIATAIVTGGTPPYLYFWSVGGIADDVTVVENIAPGAYNLNVVDGSGCNIQESFLIETSEAPTITLSAETTICGQPNGSASVVAQGGNPPYNYVWDTTPTQFTTDITDLAAGTYCTTITDASGCTISDCIIVEESAGPSIVEITTVESNCNQADGSASVVVSGGTGIITYTWDDPTQTTADITGLLAGSYNVTVADELGCFVVGTAIISDAGAPIAEISGVNATCGDANGSASVVVSGGSGTYTYEWDNDPALNTADINNVSSGLHSVIVTDVNGCIVTASIELLDTGVPVAVIQPEPTTCGQNNGSATVIPDTDFGTPPYIYEWSENGQTSEIISDLAAGDYFVTVTDQIGCTTTASTTVLPSEELQVVGDQITATCDLPNGEAAAVPLNGQSPYTYNWSDTPQNNSIATGLFAGDYTAIVTDAIGCTASVMVTVQEILPPILSTTKTDVTCNADNGSISVSVNNGTAPFTYQWSPNANGQETATINNLAAGNYSVTVTDDNDCEVIISETILNIEVPTATLTFTEATCGQSNATVTCTTNSGIEPFTYQWSTGIQTTPTITGVPASSVSVTVTDANNCTVVEQINVTSSDSPTASISNTIEPTCGNANGSATVTATDGIPPYSYNWNTTPPQSGATANNLVAGNYIVTVSDGNGCVATANVTLTDIAGPTISVSENDATCGNANGDATVTVNGGTAGFSYVWTNATGQNVGTDITATNLAAGNYTIIVTDANDCEATENITIGDSAIPTVTTTTTNASCGQADGTATAIGNGGAGSYTYQWDTNANNQTTATATGLVAGSYTVTITDANGCENTEIANVIDDNAPSASVTTTNEICGQQNGTATVTVTGGLAPYTYAWEDENGANVGSTDVATNLTAGNYNIAVTDANGCVATATATVEETAGPTLTISNTTATCGDDNGTATVVANGGLAPYTYAWEDANVGTTENANNLFSGDYTVTVTDANGCTATISTTIDDTELPQVNVTATNSTCGESIGTVTANVSNGTAPYFYEWNDASSQTTQTATALAAGVYTVTITDNVGCSVSASGTIEDEGGPTATISSSTNPTCNGSNGEATVTAENGTEPYAYLWDAAAGGQETATATDLAAGTYNVDVTDANGCVITAEVILVNEAIPTLNTSSTNSTCGDANGTATVTDDGVAAPYTYLWNDATGQTTATATSLLAGDYSVTVTDVNACETIASVTVEDTAGPSVSITPTAASCQTANGSATAIPQDGTAPYTYEWNTTPTAQLTDVATNLAAGDYEVTITDINGCTAFASTTIGDTPVPTVSATSTNANCALANGTATATAADGIAPYEYLWDANADSQSTATAIDLAPNTYSVTTTDANGCTAETTVTVGDDGSPTVSLATTDPTCGLDNGEIVATAADGLAPYTYLWDDATAQTTATATNLLAGTYTVIVTDANGCEVTETVTLNDNGNPTATLTNTDSTCGDANGTATVTASGGTGAYTYIWSDTNSQTDATATGLLQGNYSVTVTDTNGCEVIVTILVGNIDGPTATTTIVAATCGLADGSATVTAADGTAPYAYLWDENAISQTTETATNLATGTYNVTVTDANGCIAVETAEVVGFMLPPIITCGESTTSSVTFNWEAVSGAVQYEINIDGSFTENVDASILTYTVEGLSPGQEVDISIVAVGEAVCGESEVATQICQTLLCPDISLNISGLNDVYCVGDENAILSGTPAGGIFSGNGVLGETFSPTLAGVGIHTITYNYAENNCQYDTTNVVSVSSMSVTTSPTTTVLETLADVELNAFGVSGLDGAISYEWSPAETLDCNDCESVIASPIETTQYNVIATDEYGCVDSSFAVINYDFNNVLTIPNAFSPNGDGNNDIFRVLGLNVAELEVQIYDRWGVQVFEYKTSDLLEGWDGKFKDSDCELGVYVYYAKVTFVDGSEEFTKGNVTLIR